MISLSKKEILIGRLHEMVLMVLIIGNINIYQIFKNVKITLFDIIIINDNNLLFIFLISILFFLIFFKKNNLAKGNEFDIILGLGLIALNIIIMSNDLIVFYLALELYSLSVYLLLYKNEKIKAEITVLYFLLGSISSSLILFAIAIFYYFTGSLNMIFNFQYFSFIFNYHSNFLFYLGPISLIIGLLFKLGASPFQFWVIKIYNHMDLRILIYQSIIPKIIYIVLLLFLCFNLNIPFFSYLLLFSAFLSLFIGSINALFYKVHNFKILFAYSSVLHVGFLLIGIATIIIDNTIYVQSWANIMEYLGIYSINTFQILLAFSLLQMQFNNKLIINKYLFIFSILISLFSFIGIPPLAGFYAKLNIIMNCYNTNNKLLYLAIIIIIISTLISTFLYLKFFNFFNFKTNPIFFYHQVQTSDITLSYIYSLLTILLILYPFFSNYCFFA